MLPKETKKIRRKSSPLRKKGAVQISAQNISNTSCFPITSQVFLETLACLFNDPFLLVLFYQIINNLRNFFTAQKSAAASGGASSIDKESKRMRKTATTRIAEAVKALALCHNVTPVFEGGDNTVDDEATEADQQQQQNNASLNSPGQSVTYQASSPDEVALVSWSEEMGLALVDRDLSSMKLKTPNGDIVSYTILQVKEKIMK